MSCYDEKSEQTVLAAVMFAADRAFHEVSWLRPEDFANGNHRAIWEAILVLTARGTPIDQSTIRGELARVGRAGGLTDEVFSAIAGEYGTPETVAYHGRRVASKARRARWRGVLMDMAASSRNETDDEAFFERIESSMVALSQDTAGGEELVPMTVVIRRALDRLEARRETPGGNGVPSGFWDIDSLTGGWEPSDFVIVAARPSMGKTAWGVQAALNAARAGSLGAIFSLEMSSSSLGERAISAEGDLDATALRTGRTPMAAWLRAGAAASKLSELPLWFDDTAALSIEKLRSRARRWRAGPAKDKKAFVMVDYLGLIGTDDEKEYDSVTKVSKQLKALAKELALPVIALCQLSREVERRADKRPMMSDLRSSGQLEQDADYIAFLYRDEVYNPETKDPAVAEFIMGKARQGPTFTARLGWKAATTSFYSLTRGT